MKFGNPVVHGAVAGWVSQPVSYDMEKPCRSDVNDSVGGGAVTGEGVGTGVLVGVALGLGLGDGSPPTPDGCEG